MTPVPNQWPSLRRDESGTPVRGDHVLIKRSGDLRRSFQKLLHGEPLCSPDISSVFFNLRGKFLRLYLLRVRFEERTLPWPTDTVIGAENRHRSIKSTEPKSERLMGCRSDAKFRMFFVYTDVKEYCISLSLSAIEQLKDFLCGKSRGFLFEGIHLPPPHQPVKSAFRSFWIFFTHRRPNDVCFARVWQLPLLHPFISALLDSQLSSFLL